MTIHSFRLTQSRFAATAFSGEGAAEYGGRWNSPGTRVVYTSGSLSLATLELLVDVEDLGVMDGRYTVIPIAFDERLVKGITPGKLPPRWNGPVASLASQSIGDAWIAHGESAVLQAPSAFIPSEHNYLINPAHPDFKKIKTGKESIFTLDPRLRAK